MLGGFCPGGFCPGDFVRGDFVLIPNSPTREFCAILSRDLVAQEMSLSLTYGRPVES